MPRSIHNTSIEIPRWLHAEIKAQAESLEGAPPTVKGSRWPAANIESR